MSFLVGVGVRIIVHEPYEWNQGNLFGTIIYARGKMLIRVKLSKPIKGSKLTSDILELSPRYEKETFKPLLRNASVTIGGALIAEETGDFDYIIIGSVTVD